MIICAFTLRNSAITVCRTKCSDRVASAQWQMGTSRNTQRPPSTRQPRAHCPGNTLQVALVTCVDTLVYSLFTIRFHDTSKLERLYAKVGVPIQQYPRRGRARHKIPIPANSLLTEPSEPVPPPVVRPVSDSEGIPQPFASAPASRHLK